jgi:hypothetical protein
MRRLRMRKISNVAAAVLHRDDRGDHLLPGAGKLGRIKHDGLVAALLRPHRLGPGAQEPRGLIHATLFPGLLVCPRDRSLGLVVADRL